MTDGRDGYMEQISPIGVKEGKTILVVGARARVLSVGI
jgi:hypothetical protein